MAIPVPTARSEPQPEQIGDYRVVRKLGEGGMGVVYEVRQDHPVEQTIRVRGMGNYSGRDLTSAVADVLIADGGSATVRVEDLLRATIEGSGNIYNIGDPVVESSISGSGDVVKIGG